MNMSETALKDNLIEQYQELVTLSRHYLLQEYPQSEKVEWIESSLENYTFFKTIALEKTAPQSKPNNQNSLTTNNANSSLKTLLTPSTRSPVLSPSLPFPPQPTQAELVASRTIINVEEKNLIKKNEEEKLHSPSSKAQTSILNNEPETKVETIITTTIDQKILLQPFTKQPLQDLNDLKKIILEKFPQWHFIEKIPGPELISEGAPTAAPQQMKSSILILSLNEPLKHKVFLENIAKVLKKNSQKPTFANASIIEKEKKWMELLMTSSINFVIASQATLQQLPELMKLYCQNEEKHFLQNKPFLLLSDLSLYLKQPQLKFSLWKDLQKLL